MRAAGAVPSTASGGRSGVRAEARRPANGGASLRSAASPLPADALVSVIRALPIPDALLPATPNNGDLAHRIEHAEHRPHLALAHQRCASRPVGRWSSISRERSGRAAQLAQDIEAERGVALQELPCVALPCAFLRAHPRAQERQFFNRREEGVPFDELFRLPEQVVELRPVVPCRACSEDQMLRRGDRGDRIELQEAERARC